MKIRLKSQAHLVGNVHIVCRDRRGRIVHEQRVKNLVVDTGQGIMAGLIAGNVAKPSHLAVGDDNTAVTSADTALGNETHRIQLTSSSVAGNVMTAYAYLPSSQGNGATLREAGIFNSSSGATLFARATISSIVKDSSISVTFTWQFTITSS